MLTMKEKQDKYGLCRQGAFFPLFILIKETNKELDRERTRSVLGTVALKGFFWEVPFKLRLKRREMVK